MDYIQKKLIEQAELYKFQNNQKDKSQSIDAYMEYCLNLLFGFVYNQRNHDNTDSHDLKKMIRPPLGTIIGLIEKWNKKNNTLNNTKDTLDIFRRYVEIRNNTQRGHGIDYSNTNENIEKELDDLFLKLQKSIFFSIHFNLIKIIKVGDNIEAVNYSHQNRIKPITIPSNFINEAKVGDIYLQYKQGSKLNFWSGLVYKKISPFITIKDNDFYIFQSVSEPLTGTVKYNNLFKTEQRTFTYEPFIGIGIIESNEDKIYSNKSGIIKNNYSMNYDDFIDSASHNILKTEILNFLKKKSSSVASIWGHGGVGKTATIQNVCNWLFNQDQSHLQKKKLYFNYLLFLSAKDRKYDYHTGEIEDLNEKRLTDYNDFVSKLNSFLFEGSEEENEDLILKRFYSEFQGRILIVIDDFETLSETERDKIIDFTDNLDIDKHKVIISSRIAIKTGKEIEKKEFNEVESIDFLMKSIKDTSPLSIEEKDKLNEPDIKMNIFKVTSGRPIFLFHFLHIWEQVNDIEDCLNFNIQESKNAIDFLYGRFYDYLNPEEQVLFKTLGSVVSKNSLMLRKDNLQFYLKDKIDNLSLERSINNLEKYRIISLSTNRDLIHIYSREIHDNMRSYLEKDEALSNYIKELKLSPEFILFDQGKSLFEQKLARAHRVASLSTDIDKIVDEFLEIVEDESIVRTNQMTAFEELINHILNKSVDYSYAKSLCKDWSDIFRNEMKFNLIWFDTLIKCGQKVDAFKIAEKVMDDSIKLEKSEMEIKLELSGRYLRILFKQLIDKKNQINSDRDYTESEKKKIGHDVIFNIENHKKYIDLYFNDLKSIESFAYFNHKKLDIIMSGLYQCAKAVVRIRKSKNKQKAKTYEELLDNLISFGIANAKGQLRDNFYNLRNQVRGYRDSSQNTETRETEIGEQLRKALEEKNNNK